MRTCLRCVTGVYPLDADTPPLGLVGDTGPEAGERPAMQAALATVGFFRRDTGADIGQVLDGDGRALRHAIHDTARHDVIVVASPPSRLARELLQVSFGALGALRLELTPQAEVAGFQFTPAPLPVTPFFSPACHPWRHTRLKASVN